MSAHGQATFHRFTEPRHDDTPEADRWPNDDHVWSAIDRVADEMRRHPSFPQERNR